MSNPVLLPVEAFEAISLEHREQLAKAQMQLVVYRDCLERHGIEPPDMTGADLLEMYRDCSRVISTASEFVSRLGSAKELLDEPWRRNA